MQLLRWTSGSCWEWECTASQVLAFTLSLCAAVSSAAFAEAQFDPTREHAAAPDDAAQFSGQSKALTGKERLGPKWSDEQRIDNCNVPADTCSNAAKTQRL
jgi:hypothetical protein